MRFRHLPCSVALAVAALGFSLSWTNDADAAGGAGKAQLGFDLDWASADHDDESWAGAGGALRLGYEIDALFATLIPEIGGSYHSFSNLDTSVYRGLVGARVRFLKVLEPGIYGHFGVGHADSDRPLLPSRTAGTMDLGLSLDFTLLPVIEFGGHAGYNSLFGGEDSNALNWWNAGLQLAIIL